MIFTYRGRHLSYQRGKRNTNPGTRYEFGCSAAIDEGLTQDSLLKIEGVDDANAARLVYIGIWHQFDLLRWIL